MTSEIFSKEFEEIQNRDLSQYEIEYLFLDAIYETSRARFGIKEAVLCAWGWDGHKVLLHLALGNKESCEDWLSFLRDMVKRGLRTPTTVTTDGAPGLIKAVEVVFPKSLKGNLSADRQGCWYHRMQNFCSKVPEEVWSEIKAEIMAIRDAAGYEQGKQMAYEFIEKYREKLALKLVFSVLIRAAKRWRRVNFTKTELNCLDKLREELGIREGFQNTQELKEVC